MTSVMTCAQCGAKFTDPKHPHRKYCSRKCVIASQTKRARKTCPGCGIVFDQHSPKQKYCTPECAYQHRPRPRDEAKRSTFTCQWCGKEFDEWTYRQPSFCSNQCRSEYGARQPRPSARRPESFVTLKCEICGKPYTVHKAQTEGRNSRYCSNECRYAGIALKQQGSGNPNYRGGTIRHRGTNWEAQKRRALKRDGHRCQICHKKLGRKPWDYGIHHIKPYREFGGNYIEANRLSNLITLCRSCHAKVEFGHLPCPRPLP